MALHTYNQKRRFNVTPEPAGKRGRSSGHAFVIQKHAATRLHYDLRLELDGVMLSWAVTRGPSLMPGEKRLAMHVEDHPVAYNQFEGTIPKGEYGGGTVMIWDRGVWIPDGDPRAGMKKGRLDFRLEGEKLQGRWHLVRMRQRPGERQEPWLLIKANDEAARTAKQPDILEEEPRSAATGRTMEEIAAGKGDEAVWRSNRTANSEWQQNGRTKVIARGRDPKSKGRTASKHVGEVARKSDGASKARVKANARRAGDPLPDFVEPCLAQLSIDAPDSVEWIHEIKFDGYRMQARIANGEVRLLTRTGLDWTDKFRSLAGALKKLPVETALIDGETVVEGEGISNFSALQEALKSGRGELLFYAFDLLHLDGRDLRSAPLIERKQRLQDLFAQLPRQHVLRFSEHFEVDGPALLRHACEIRLEGIVSKRRNVPYRSGRTGDWIKTKCSGRQEFVIIGYAPATNDARAVGALILGHYDDGELRYAGRVGTGFTRKTAREVWRELDPLQTKTPPLKPIPAEERRRPGYWVEPRLVAEIDSRGWTAGGRLRHPSFQGLRYDKIAQEVRDEAKGVAPAAPPAETGSARPKKTPKRTRAPVATPAPQPALTNPDRVYWEDVGLTKRGLAEYYTQVWDWIAPHVTGRALSLVRCPEGARKHCFFQKHASAGLETKHLRLVPEDDDHVIAIDHLDGLHALVQAGVLEIHVRGSTTARLEAANRIVFDLDPSEEVGWTEVVRATREVRERLGALGLNSYLKTTGGKGLHVVLPIDDTEWDRVKAFARGIATAMAGDSPARYVATASKSARRGRIFVDYLRNSREATAICAYSTRARDRATVSVPITWSELGSLKAPNLYDVGNLMQRLRRLKADPWADIGRERQRLPR